MNRAEAAADRPVTAPNSAGANSSDTWAAGTAVHLVTFASGDRLVAGNHRRPREQVSVVRGELEQLSVNLALHGMQPCRRGEGLGGVEVGYIHVEHVFDSIATNRGAINVRYPFFPYPQRKTSHSPGLSDEIYRGSDPLMVTAAAVPVE